MDNNSDVLFNNIDKLYEIVSSNVGIDLNNIKNIYNDQYVPQVKVVSSTAIKYCLLRMEVECVRGRYYLL